LAWGADTPGADPDLRERRVVDRVLKRRVQKRGIVLGPGAALCAPAVHF
jgi:hypothetical protein